MTEGDKFSLENGPPGRPDAAASPGLDQPEPAHSWRPTSSTAYQLDAKDVDASGANLAGDMEDKNYQPVILFGNAFSGKTSLLLSLLASVKTETHLDTGLFLAEPLLARDTLYGRYQSEQSEAFFGRKTQEFIQGTASPKTAIDLPFFVPVTLRPRNRLESTLAFMESNGEWYRPVHGSDKLYPALRQQIEDFIASYQGGIIFIHLLPYTQQAVRSANADTTNDAQEVRDASLAVVGAVHAYQRLRVDKKKDVHLMLVTKWDAHEPGADRAAVLGEEDSEAVNAFARDRYDQVVTTLRGIGLEPNQVMLNAYCAGLINERGVLALRRDNDLRDVVMQYPINLWRFLYKQALLNRDLPPVDPFPAKARPPWWQRLLDRLF